jgi:ComF family protein
MNDWLRPLLDFIFPPRCVHCGQLGAYLCARCRAEAPRIGPDICIRCGNPLTTRGLCQRCQHHPPESLQGIRGVCFYKGPIAKSLRALKYHGQQALAPILATYLIDYMRAHPHHFDALVPVPLHPEKRAERGFNQSELLAASVARALQIPLQTQWLQRIRYTRPQAKLSRSQRLQNVVAAFAPAPGLKLKNQSILIIDDVATTGATLQACAQALEQAGATEIWALTVARAHITATQTSQDPVDAFLIEETPQA